MTGYADPEILIGTWLHAQTGLKVYVDRDFNGNERSLAAVAHLQRAPGSDDVALSLDDVLLDIDVYAADSDHARNAANTIWSAMTFQLPRTTFDNGVFVTRSVAVTRPCWAPDPTLKRRTAAYRVILHGIV